MQIPSHFDPTVRQQLEHASTTSSQSMGAAEVDSGIGFGPASAGTGAAPVGASLGTSVVTLTQTALSQPDVRSERVDALRHQIASGTYQVSPSQIAAAVLADPLTGLGSIGRD